MYCLSLEDGTDRLSRNVRNILQINAPYHLGSWLKQRVQFASTRREKRPDTDKRHFHSNPFLQHTKSSCFDDNADDTAFFRSDGRSTLLQSSVSVQQRSTPQCILLLHQQLSFSGSVRFETSEGPDCNNVRTILILGATKRYRDPRYETCCRHCSDQTHAADRLYGHHIDRGVQLHTHLCDPHIMRRVKAT